MPAFDPPEPTGPYIIKGISLEPGESLGIRYELRDLIDKDKDTWNLYLLGLWQFQLVPQKKLLSYFQIAGIHGRPYTSWPENDRKILDKARSKDFGDGSFGGFCTHSSILFLTWHRPYLSLFESLLRDAMIHVSKQFTEDEGKEKYLAKAKAFRMPFWDWARSDRPVFPNEATERKWVPVKMPASLANEYPKYPREGKLVEIPNPLFSYSFQPGTDNQLKVDSLDYTTRYHLPGVKDPKDQQAILIKTLMAYTSGKRRQLEINLRERLVYILQSYDLFKQISNNRLWPPDRRPGQDESDVKGRGFGSIEDIHNTIHVLVGGLNDKGDQIAGQMTDPAISAFDPIFWLHHTNIDRLLAIWQGLRKEPGREEAWVTTQVAEDENWATAIKDKENNSTDLLPFYKTPEKFWKSSDVRDTAKFGYAYPETFENNKPLDRDSIKAKILALYSSASIANIVMAKRAGDEDPETTIKKRAQTLAQIEQIEAPNTALTGLRLAHTEKPIVASKLLEPILEPVVIPPIQIGNERSVYDILKDETYLEWLVNIKAEKHALGGSYLVHIFLGTVPSEESTILYPASPYHVGTFYPFGQTETTSCGKCKVDQAGHLEITGQIPLTIALAERYFAGHLDSFDVDVVKVYLQKNLHWEVVDANGARLKDEGARDRVNGLLVGVVSNEVTLPSTPDGFPSYSEYVTVYPEITTKEDASQGGRAEGTGVTEDNKHSCC